MVFLDEADLDEKEALLKHVVSCQECSLKFDVLQRLRYNLQTQVETLQNKIAPTHAAKLLDKTAGSQLEKRIKQKTNSFFSPFFQRTTAKFALAASLFFIVAVTGVFFILRIPRTELVRGEAGQKLTLIEPLGTLSQPPFYFRWTKFRNEDYYWFRLIDDSLNTLAEADVHDGNIYVLPPLIRDQLKKYTTYIWSVEAVDENNKILDVISGHFSIDK